MGETEERERRYIEHRNKAWEDIKSGSENFDRSILTLSSVALGLSLAFINDIVPLAKAACLLVPHEVLARIRFGHRASRAEIAAFASRFRDDMEYLHRYFSPRGTSGAYVVVTAGR